MMIKTKAMKLILHKRKWSHVWKVAAALAIMLIVGCYVTIEAVTQPASVDMGSPLVVTLTTQTFSNTSQTQAVVVGVLVPKIWNAASNMTVTFTSDITSGDQPMTVIPASVAAPGANGNNWPTDMLNTLGHAGNLIPEYEWVAFMSNQQYTSGGNQTINEVFTITCNVGHQNLLFNMGYVVAESNDGLHSTAWGDPPTSYYGTFFPGSVRVNGTGTLMDFVNPQLSVATPSTATDNDIITIPFNAVLVPNGLSSVSPVYLCATGYLSNGDSIQVCQQNSQSKMTLQSAGNWATEMWPRGFFKLTSTQSLDSLHYFFTDQTGTIKVGYGGSSSVPFSFDFGCN
jgi:hypothetical protein